MNTFSQPPAFAYLETTIPVGMTIADYRASRPATKRSRRRQLKRRLRTAAFGSRVATA